MLLKLISFELKFHLKQTSYVLFTVLFFLAGIYFASQEGAIRSENRYNIHLFTSIISLAVVFQIIFQTVYTVLRDTTHNTTQLIHTTSVKKSHFLISRFLGIFITSSFSSFLYVVALYVCVKANVFGFHSSANTLFIDFLWPWIIIVLPNVFIVSGLLFDVALFTKKSPPIFLAGIAILVLFMMNNFYIGSPFTGGKLVVPQDVLQRAAHMDILGLCSSYEQTQFWSPLEKNSQLVSFSGILLFNRVLWMSAALISLLISFVAFSFRLPQRKPSLFKKVSVLKRKKQRVTNNVSASYFHVFTIKKSLLSKAKEFLSLVKIDFKGTLFSRTFLLLCLVWVGMLVAAILHNISGQSAYGSLLPTTGLLAGLILEPLSQIGLFLVVFYAGELIWKSRQYKFHEILDTTPAQNNILLFSKYSALFLLPLFITALGVIVGMLIQVAVGTYLIDLGLYLKLFFYGSTSLFIYGLIAVFTQQLVNNKYVGMLLSLIFIYGLGYGLPFLGIQHPLASLFKLPKIGEGYSDFNGYGQLTNAFEWMSLLWISAVLILLLISFKIYKRSTEYRLKDQLALAFKHWKNPQRIVLGILLSLICISAVTIDKKSRESTSFVDIPTESLFREKYEKNFVQFINKAHPVISHVKTKVELYPKELSYRVDGEYTILNNSTKPMDTILLNGPLRFTQFSMEGASIIQQDTSVMDVKLLVFNPVLLPNETRMMQFTAQKNVGSFELQHDILQNGTYLRNASFEPRFGYQKVFEISSKSIRKKRGLPEERRESLPRRKLAKPKQEFETWLTTNVDQIAIAPGRLLDTKKKNNRVTYHYKSREKTDNNISYFSSKYAVAKEIYQGVSLEVYHLPEHASNISDILKAAKATLDYGTENFGQYPYDHLRIAEVPLHWKFGGHALSGTIAFQERFFTQNMRDPKKGIDQLSRVVIHEIAHQWFGHKLSPAPGKGANMLSETMANYVEGQVLEKMYGKTVLRRLANSNRRRYFSFKSSSENTELPLCHVNNETYIAYRKGFLMMQSLKELIGEDPLSTSLKQLIDAHTKEQSARSSDFLRIVKSGLSNDKIKVIEDWFEKIIRYDISLTDYEVVESDDRRIKVSLDISAKRFETLKSGQEKEIPMDESITIGFYQKHPDDIRANPIFKRVAIGSENSKLTFLLDEMPRYIVLDPLITRLDEDLSDNMKELEE